MTQPLTVHDIDCIARMKPLELWQSDWFWQKREQLQDAARAHLEGKECEWCGNVPTHWRSLPSPPTEADMIKSCKDWEKEAEKRIAQGIPRTPFLDKIAPPTESDEDGSNTDNPTQHVSGVPSGSVNLPDHQESPVATPAPGEKLSEWDKSYRAANPPAPGEGDMEFVPWVAQTSPDSAKLVTLAREQIAHARGRAEKSRSRKKGCDDLSDMVWMLSNRAEELATALEALRKERDDARESVWVMGERCAALRKEKHISEQFSFHWAETLTKAQAEIEALRKECEECKRSRNAVEAEWHGDLKAKIQECDKLAVEAQAHITVFRKECETLKFTNAVLCADANNAQARIAELENDITRYAHSPREKEVTALRVEGEKAQARFAELEKEREDHLQAISSAYGDIVGYQNRIAELEGENKKLCEACKGRGLE